MPNFVADPTPTVKSAAALLGGGALLLMAAVTMITSGYEDPAVSTLSDPGAMSTGETTTVTYTGTIAPVVAVPPVKATPFGGNGAS